MGRQEPGTGQPHPRRRKPAGKSSPAEGDGDGPAPLRTADRSLLRSVLLLPAWPNIANVALHKLPKTSFLLHQRSAPIRYKQQWGQGSKHLVPDTGGAHTVGVVLFQRSRGSWIAIWGLRVDGNWFQVLFALEYLSFKEVVRSNLTARACWNQEGRSQ